MRRSGQRSQSVESVRTNRKSPGQSIFTQFTIALQTATGHKRCSRRSIVRKNRGGPVMSLIQEFKEFAMRGNVVDLAVGVIIGGAFGKIVSSLVADVLTPPIGYLTGGVKFDNLTHE